MNKSVAVIGGGIAGLASAVFLSEKNFNVTLFESSPKFGGRTFSYYDNEKNIWVDNGQHILAGWYENTFEYLRTIGTIDKLEFTDKLKLGFLDKQKRSYNFKCGDFPGVFGLLWGAFRFGGFDVKDKIKFLKVKKLINEKSFSREYLVKKNAGELLNEIGQTDNLKKYFWNPLILASFNAPPEYVSADLFVNLVKKAVESKKNMTVVLSDANLNDLFVNDAVKYLKNNSVNVNLNTPVSKINIEGKFVKNIETSDSYEISADYYVCTVPFFSINKLFEKNKNSRYICKTEQLKSSAIISVHIFLRDDFNPDFENKMLGLVDTVVQWIFVKSKRHLCLVISASDFISGNLTDKNSDEIFKICIDDLKSCLNVFDEKNVVDFKVIKEKRATFIPEKGCEKFRLKQKSDIENLFFGGDWTDTGYPATIEGAVKSAKVCSGLILNNY